MKRFIAIFLIFLYAGVSSGASLNFHYCMGELKGMSLSQRPSDRCDNCGMQKSKSLNKNCCKDKQHKFKIGKDQRTVSSDFQFPALLPVILPAKYNYQHSADVVALAVAYPVSQGPPSGSCVPVYLLNHTFRI
jgi:hypothetical protein